MEDEFSNPVDTLYVRIVHPSNFDTNLIPNKCREYRVLNWTNDIYKEIIKESLMLHATGNNYGNTN